MAGNTNSQLANLNFHLLLRLLVMANLSLFSIHALAQFSNVGFWTKRGSSLFISSSSQTILSGLCSGSVTVVTRNAGNVATNVSSNLTVDLTGSSGVTFYSDDSCTTAVTGVTIASGSNNKNFYFLATTAGSATVTASAPGYKSISQTQTINTNSFIWTGNGGNANWNTAANWAGGVAPGSGNIAVFDSSCVSNCSPNLTANTSVGGVRLNSGYAGTITQNSGFTLSVGNSGWIQLAGTFNGSNSGDAITIKTRLSLMAGSFKATSGTLSVELFASYTQVIFEARGSSTFLANSGSLVLDGGCTTNILYVGSSTLNNLMLKASAGCPTFRIEDTNVTIAGNLSLGNPSYSGNLAGGTFSVGGNVSTDGTDIWDGTAGIKLTGNPSGQTITSTNLGAIPNLTIAAGANPVTLVGTIRLNQSYNYVSSGTFTATGSTLYFRGNCSTFAINPGTVTYNNVQFNGSCTNYNFSGATMKIDGNLVLDNPGYGSTMTSATLAVAGNLTTTGPDRWYGNGIIKLTGRVSGQTITASGPGRLPNLTIDVGANPLTLSGSLAVSNYVVTSLGTFTSTGSTLQIQGPTATVGTENYNNVTFGGGCTGITLSGTMNVLGNLHFSDGCSGSLNGSTVAVRGNLSTDAWGGGSSGITFNGSTQQTITQTAGTFPGGAITLNNANGLLLATNATFNGDSQTFSVTNGNISMAGKSFTLKNLSLNGYSVTRSGGSLTVNGSAAPAGTVSLYGGTVNP